MELALEHVQTRYAGRGGSVPAARAGRQAHAPAAARQGAPTASVTAAESRHEPTDPAAVFLVLLAEPVAQLSLLQDGDGPDPRYPQRDDDVGREIVREECIAQKAQEKLDIARVADSGVEPPGDESSRMPFRGELRQADQDLDGYVPEEPPSHTHCGSQTEYPHDHKRRAGSDLCGQEGLAGPEKPRHPRRGEPPPP